MSFYSCLDWTTLLGAWLSADSVTKLVCSQTWQGWPTLRREEEPPKLRGSGGWEVGGGGERGGGGEGRGGGTGWGGAVTLLEVTLVALLAFVKGGRWPYFGQASDSQRNLCWRLTS